eukprot:SAG31_NODE_3039_length_4757_cov_2.892228_1_plen_190_part_00
MRARQPGSQQQAQPAAIATCTCTCTSHAATGRPPARDEHADMYSSECLLLEVAAIALTALLPTAPAAALAPAGLPQVVARLQPQARAASAAATPQLLARLDSPWFRHGLRECCPVAAKLTAQSLLARLEAEFLTAELTHNFNPVNSPATWENDVSVATLQNASHFYNLWVSSASVKLPSTPAQLLAASC